MVVEQENKIPKGFLQWLVWFTHHLPQMCLLMIYIFALIPIFYLPPDKQTTACILAGMYWGAFSEAFNRADKKDKLETKVANILGFPFLSISIIFMIVWVCIQKYPAEFLPHWAMGLVVFVGGCLGMGIVGTAKSHREQNKNERIQEQKRYDEKILKNKLAEKVKSTGFTINEKEKLIYLNYDEEFVDLVKQVKGKK